MKDNFWAERTSANKNEAPNEATGPVESYESESPDTERSRSTRPDNDTTSRPHTRTRLPWEPGENRNSSTTSNLPISGLYAEFAQRALPAKLGIDLGLEVGSTYGDAAVAGLFAAAAQGNVPAVREIREGIEKANQRQNPAAPEKFELVITYESPLAKMLPEGSSDAPHDKQPS